MTGFNFTDKVRKVLADARLEAERLHHPAVGTEHILLALTHADQSVAGAVLRNLSINPEALRQRIEQGLEVGRTRFHQPNLPYTEPGKKVLELAMFEARELNHNYV